MSHSVALPPSPPNYYFILYTSCAPKILGKQHLQRPANLNDPSQAQPSQDEPILVRDQLHNSLGFTRAMADH